MKIVIAGSNGMIGSALRQRLLEQGHEVIRLVRHLAGQGEIWWSPDKGEIDVASLEGCDALINLATMPWPLRWNARAKEEMLANRLATNGLLSATLAGLDRKPAVLVCASGMGYYASSGEDILTEDCPAGETFLARLQRSGEEITAPASTAGIRVVHLRIPPVLGGAALQRAAFQAGDGSQWVSWIGLDELVEIIKFCIQEKSITGAVNAVSPIPLRNRVFAAISARAQGKNRVFRLPAFLVRLLMGEMGEELILASRQIYPAKLAAAGYHFRFQALEDALRHEMDIAGK